MSVGIYLHIPFCEKKCDYCAFKSFDSYEDKIIDKYVNSLLNEINSFKYDDLDIDTLYFGGGTPSILKISAISKIINCIKEKFNFKQKKITFEINPIHFSANYIKQLKDLRINRFSIGIQSFNKNKLKKLGRIHDLNNINRIYNNRKLLENFSMDLIFGLKNDYKIIQNELKSMLDFNPDHISIYNLKVEKNTPLEKKYNKNNNIIDSDQKQADTYELINKILKKNQYNHYEISNYAKKNKKSVHNLKYWRFKHYLGFGLSASGYYNNIIYKNKTKLKNYLNNNYKYDKTLIDNDDKRYYKIMMGLRLKEGVKLTKNELKKIKKNNSIKKYISINNRSINIKEKYFFISNSIIGKILTLIFG